MAFADNNADSADEEADTDFKALSREEVIQWRLRHPPLSPWSVVAGQVTAGFAVAGLVWLLSGRPVWAASFLYGVLAVALPAALMARALARPAGVAGAALLMFFVWELVKLLLTVMLLVLAPRLVDGLNWLALLAGLVVAVQMYGLVLWWHGRHRKAASRI